MIRLRARARDDAKGDLKKMETSIREIIGEILDMVKTVEGD